MASAGDGKTHYIKQQLRRSSHSLTIAVNEAFTPLSAIKKLRTLPPSQRDCAVFLNFTMLPPGVSSTMSYLFIVLCSIGEHICDLSQATNIMPA